MLRTTLGIGVLALALAACAEKPPRVEHKEEASSALPRGAGDPMRERALSQGESARIYH